MGKKAVSLKDRYIKKSIHIRANAPTMNRDEGAYMYQLSSKDLYVDPNDLQPPTSGCGAVNTGFSTLNEATLVLRKMADGTY